MKIALGITIGIALCLAIGIRTFDSSLSKIDFGF